MDEFNVSNAVKALADGEVIVYPTDTLYGMGVDIFNEDAVRKVFEIKKRPFDQPLSVAVSSIDDIEKIAFVDDETRRIAPRFLPGKLTLILPKKKSVSDVVTGGLGKIAVRIPANKIALKLVSDFGPITATSANIHGEKTPAIINEINMHFKDSVSVYIDDGKLEGEPSTIVEIVDKNVKILREGAIKKQDILDAVRYER
jgi:L-threonylcarbamoyladenylate synthase